LNIKTISILPEQLTHKTTPLSKNTCSIVLVCDGVTSPANIGGLFRLSDALGIQHIFFCGNKIDITSSRVKRTSRHTHTIISHSDGLNVVDTLHNLKTKGYTALVLELTNKSKPLQDAVILDNKPLALIIGNEKEGVSKRVLEEINNHVHIEMLGNNSSMNVTQATAIAVYTLSKKIKEYELGKSRV
jgi:tRNA G18 (ribose-2'-O)-methylase SpoU